MNPASILVTVVLTGTVISLDLCADALDLLRRPLTVYTRRRVARLKASLWRAAH